MHASESQNSIKKISLLGSTGSIGTQALAVCDAHREEFSVTCLAGGRNVELLSRQIETFCPPLAVCARKEDADTLAERYGRTTKILWGSEGLMAAATCDCDLVINGLMGIVGLAPTYGAIQAGRDVALANKETLVAGGDLIMTAIREKGVNLLPVDSEHSAIFQCLQGNENNPIERILLTGSGGPFRTYDAEALRKVTLAQALRHPRWTMGRKITIDSATMMNKGLEVIEARWLFDLPPENIQVVIHPESIIHSMVEFADGATMAQMGVPDMKVPIAYAMSWPRRTKSDFDRLDFSQAMSLQMEPPDMKRFPCLALAYEALREGGSAPAALNGANEALVGAFLEEKISFDTIPTTLERWMQKHQKRSLSSIEEILAVDREARKAALELAGLLTDDYEQEGRKQ